jgi:hypothetical protein
MLVILVAGPVLGPVGEALFAVTVVLFPVALILLANPRARPALRVALGLLAALLTLSSLGILWLAATGPAERMLGLPPATWLMLVGLGLLPFLIVFRSYAATFESPDSDRRNG